MQPHGAHDGALERLHGVCLFCGLMIIPQHMQQAMQHQMAHMRFQRQPPLPGLALAYLTGQGKLAKLAVLAGRRSKGQHVCRPVLMAKTLVQIMQVFITGKPHLQHAARHGVLMRAQRLHHITNQRPGRVFAQAPLRRRHTDINLFASVSHPAQTLRLHRPQQSVPPAGGGPHPCR